jgi:hypothetical protein
MTAEILVIADKIMLQTLAIIVTLSLWIYDLDTGN